MVSTRNRPAALAPVTAATTDTGLLSPTTPKKGKKAAASSKTAHIVGAPAVTTVMPATAASTAKEVTLVSPTADKTQDFSKLQTSSSGHNYRFILAAMVVAGLVGIYIGARFFSENTAPVKELCDRTIALVREQETQICRTAVAAMDAVMNCTSKFFNVTQAPLQTLLPIFENATRQKN